MAASVNDTARAGAEERAHLRFALAVHRGAAAHGGDACSSPYSIASALGLVASAGAGATADEPAALVAAEPATLEGLAGMLAEAAALRGAANQEEPELAVSNTLWAWDELELGDGFTAELASWPDGGVRTAPFVADPEAARRTINADVASTTRELIPELLEPGSLDAETVATLVNALYLRLAWVTPFPEDDTEDRPFAAPSGTRNVPTMRLTGTMGHAVRDGWQAVSLPAAGGVEAIALLPDAPLADAESALDSETLLALLAERGRERVAVELPRLSLDVRTDLKGTLHELGVRTPFTPEADFSPLTTDTRLRISDIVHQAVLRVDESGLEGAAATAATFRMVSLPTGEPRHVAFDRPFLLLVRHVATGALYFLARVVDP